MYSCKQVSRFVSESLDKKLGFWTRMQLWMHLSMCGLCSRFRKALIRVDREVKQHAQEIEHGTSSDDVRLSPQARERIQQKLKSSDL